MRYLSAFFRRHPLLLLIITVIITAVIIYHKYIFCGYVFLFDDIGSDTKQQYIMQYNAVVNHIRTGNFSLWDLTNGFGTSLYNTNLFNPLIWILYLGGLIASPSAMAGMLIYVHIFAIVCAAAAAWWFLSVFDFLNKAKLTAAYLYAFNGFITVWGQHYAFTIIMICLPILLMTLEKALRKQRFSPSLALICGLMILCTYYFSFMSLIIAALYAILRLWSLRPGGVKKYFTVLLKQAAAVSIGIGIGSVNLLPSYALVANVTSRISSSATLLAKISDAMSLWPKAYYKTLAIRFLSSGLQGNSSAAPYTGYSNFYEAPNVFFTSLIVILLIQFVIFLIIKKYDIRLKVVSVLALLIGAFMICVPAGSLPFNFFTSTFSRHTFLLMPFFALVTAFMLDRLLKEWFFSIMGGVAAGVICLYIYGIAFITSTANYTRLFAAVLSVSTVALIILIIMIVRGPIKYKKHYYLFICLILAAQVGIDGFSAVYGRECVTRDSYYFTELYGIDYAKLQYYLYQNDSELYRLEKDYTIGSKCMDALAQDYHGISTYNSTMNSNLQEFIEKLLPELQYVNGSHISFIQAADKADLHNLFGIKYIITKNSEIPYENYAPEERFGDIYLYRNTAWEGFASFYTDTVSYDEYEEAAAKGENINVSELLADALLIPESTGTLELSDYEKHDTDEYYFDDKTLPKSVKNNDNGTYTWTSNDMTEIPLNKPVSSGKENISVSFTLSSDVPMDVNVYYDMRRAPHIATVSPTTPGKINIDLPDGTTSIYLSFLTDNIPVLISDIRFMTSMDTHHVQNTEVKIADTGNDGSFTAEVNARKDGYLFIPIPYEDGWKFEADNSAVVPVKADYGFTAIPLKKGEHTVVFRYEQPYFVLSLCCTAASTGLLIILFIVCRRREKRAKS